VIYHLFVAEDNSAELFAQAQRIHSLLPYSILKNILRFSNPIAMLRGISQQYTDDRRTRFIPRATVRTKKSSPKNSQYNVE
jgi:hypothetical protein